MLHDSDDGGFSDHDDDEAAEAALLSAQLKRHGSRGQAEAAEAGTSSGAMGGVGSPAGKAAQEKCATAQAAMQPSSTPKQPNGR